MVKKTDKKLRAAKRWIRWRLYSFLFAVALGSMLARVHMHFAQPEPVAPTCDCPPPPPVDMTELRECEQARGRWKERYQDLAVAVDNDILQCDIREVLRIKNNR